MNLPNDKKCDHNNPDDCRAECFDSENEVLVNPINYKKYPKESFFRKIALEEFIKLKELKGKQAPK